MTEKANSPATETRTALSVESKRLVRLAGCFSALLVVACCAALTATARTPPRPGRVEYARPQRIGVVDDPAIIESSGLARSIVNSGAFWTHNDSGDGPRVFLIGRDGKTLAEVTVENATAVDWEDIASYRMGDEGFLLIADVGDNAVARGVYTLYIVREPRIEENPIKLSVVPSLIIPFTYEDGPHNCESIAVDASGRTIYLVSKRDGNECKVYSLELPEKQADAPAVARPIATLKLPATTAMDMSPDGLRAVVLTYRHAREYVRRPDEPWSRAFAQKGRIIAMPRREQGESICYGADGKTLYLTSEGESQPLWVVPPIPADSR